MKTQERFNERFYPATERKLDYFVKGVYFMQFPDKKINFSRRKSLCDGRKIIGLKVWEEKNNSFKTQEQYEKALVQCEYDLLEYLTHSCYIFEK